MQDLNGKKVLVFGGSSGIGKAVVMRLAEESADIVISSNDEKADKDLTTKLVESGKSAACITGDFTCEDTVVKVCNYAQKDGKIPDIVICSGGVGDHIMEMGNVTPEVMDKVFQTNVTGPYLVLQEAVNRLQKADKYGKILILGSICSHYTCKNGLSPVYAASKAAIGSLMESTRRQICKQGNKIGFTLVCPGTTNTKLVLGEEGEPQQIFMEPDYVAECIIAAAKLPDEMSITDMEMISVQQDIF